MTVQGTYECDRCGADIGNASIVNAATISTLDEQGVIRNLHWGLACGCASRVLTAATTARLGKVKLHKPTPVESEGD